MIKKLTNKEFDKWNKKLTEWCDIPSSINIVTDINSQFVFAIKKLTNLPEFVYGDARFYIEYNNEDQQFHTVIDVFEHYEKSNSDMMIALSETLIEYIDNAPNKNKEN